MFASTFMVMCVLSVSCFNFDDPSQSLEDHVMYYDDDTSQDSAEFFVTRNQQFNGTTDSSTIMSQTFSEITASGYRTDPTIQTVPVDEAVPTDDVAAESTSRETYDNVTRSDPVDDGAVESMSRETFRNATRSDTVVGGVPRKVKLKLKTIEPMASRDKSHTKASGEDLETLVNYPYVASISRRGSHYATATLVDKIWVISVASEFFNVRESIKQFSVLLGSVNCKRGKTIPLKRIELHPSYKPGRPAYDIALLRMAWPAHLSAVIKPIPLSTVDSQVSSAKYLTAYWPRIIVNERVLPPNAPERKHYNSLRISTQTLIPVSKCAELMKKTNETLDQSLLCLKPVTEFHSKCMPDPGAPVVAEHALWGITSGWKPASCQTAPRRTPTLFTRVGIYNIRLWIDTIILL